MSHQPSRLNLLLRRASVLKRVAGVGALCSLVVAGTLVGDESARERRTPSYGDDGPGSFALRLPDRAHHHYRINGKIRLLLVWVAREDVGEARISRLRHAETSSFSLLAGANPDRAPRHMNQWVYLREELNGSSATTFVVRSLTDVASIAGPTGDIPVDAAMSLSCTSVTATSARTASAKLAAAADLTYRTLDHAFDRLQNPVWDITRTALADGVLPGFLVALSKALTTSRAIPQIGTPSLKPESTVTYLYGGTVYDMTLDPRKDLATQVCEREGLAGCKWVDVRVLNQTTRVVTRFSVLYVIDETQVPVPVRIVYQPNWWLRIELQLDDTHQAVPAGDGIGLTTLRRLCDSAPVNAADKATSGFRPDAAGE